MKQEFISYEQALALRELGFDELCFKYIYIGDTGNNVDHYLEVEPSKAKNYNSDDLCISQPTFSQVFRWFREKKYQAEILWRGDFGDFCWKIGRFKYGSHFFSEDGFNTYEEAELECLKKLIELAKQQ